MSTVIYDPTDFTKYETVKEIFENGDNVDFNLMTDDPLSLQERLVKANQRQTAWHVNFATELLQNSATNTDKFEPTGKSFGVKAALYQSGKLVLLLNFNLQF